MRTPKPVHYLFVLLGAIVLVPGGIGCRQSDSPVAPESTSLIASSHGANVCVHSCVDYAQALTAEEERRFSNALDLCRDDPVWVAKEQALHREVKAETRRQLRECRQACRGGGHR